LEEIREFFFGFPPGTRPPKRWQQLSQRKIAELRERMKRLQLMETLLKRVEKCRCDALDECGERILRQSDQESQPPSHEASAYGLDFGVTSRRAKEIRRKK
jgi:hypothetical protein